MKLSENKLKKMSNDALLALCVERNIAYPRSYTKEKLVTLLLKSEGSVVVTEVTEPEVKEVTEPEVTEVTEVKETKREAGIFKSETKLELSDEERKHTIYLGRELSSGAYLYKQK